MMPKRKGGLRLEEKGTEMAYDLKNDISLILCTAKLYENYSPWIGFGITWTKQLDVLKSLHFRLGGTETSYQL